jgi:hypothetical protein
MYIHVRKFVNIYCKALVTSRVHESTKFVFDDDDDDDNNNNNNTAVLGASHIAREVLQYET